MDEEKAPILRWLALAAFSHTPSHPPCFLNLLLKEEKSRTDKNKHGSLNLARSRVVVSTEGGWNSLGSAECLSLCSLSLSHAAAPAALSRDLDINTLFLSGQHSVEKPDSLGVSPKLTT